MPANAKPEILEDLTLYKLTSGDRPSTYALGLAVSQALKQTKMSVIMVDAMGRVRIMPNEAVKVLAAPRLEDAELHEETEDGAIELLIQQGDSEAQILEYLTRRKAVKG